MRRPLFTPSTTPVATDPSPLVIFIQQPQLSLVYGSRR
jgi:hypothetical protein